MFDGYFCSARIAGPYLLWIAEGDQGPWIDYALGSGHARLIPSQGDAAVAFVGADERYLVAQTVGEPWSAVSDSWYIMVQGEHERGTNWTLVQGPFTRQEFEVRFSTLQLPPMRATR